MTIRRRLFWSNIMMLVIPIVLSAMLSYLILFVFTRRSDSPMERAFPQAFQAIAEYQKEGNLNRLLESVDRFNGAFEDDIVYMAVLQPDMSIYPESAQQLVEDRENLFYLVYQQGATGSLRLGDIRFAVEEVGDIRIVLVDQDHGIDSFLLRRPLMMQLPLIFLGLLVIILCTNRVLTRSVTRKIMAPLNALAEGARQLGEGNLDHRIRYFGQDEFTPVCEAFNEMAEQLQRLIIRQRKEEESRKELLAGMSHDLRTPLTSIKAYVEGLLDGVAENLPAQLRYLSIIRAKAEDINQIVDRLFLFSKLDIGEFPINPETIDLDEELQSMIRAAEEEYGDRGMTIRVVERLPGVLVSADPVLLHNAFVNILENSLRYCGRENCIITVHSFEQDGFATVWMTDNGPGVPEENLEKIFDVFYRGDPSRQNPSRGSGLGLAITSRIMRHIGGSIQAENVPYGGLRMILRLPVTEQSEEGEHHEADSDY